MPMLGTGLWTRTVREQFAPIAFTAIKALSGKGTNFQKKKLEENGGTKAI
jgi:hypothetical protein